MSSTGKQGLRPWRVYVALCLVAAVLVAWNLRSPEQPTEVLLLQGRDWLQAGQHVEALRLAEQALQGSPHSLQALLLAGDSARLAKDHAAAARYFDLAIAESPRQEEPFISAGDAWLDAHHCRNAEDRYRRALGVAVNTTVAEQRLAELHGVLGQDWEQRRWLAKFLRGGQATRDDLLALALRESSVAPSARLEQFLASTPGDAWVLTAIGIRDRRAGNFASAERRLRAAVQADPNYLDAQVHLGQLLLENRDDQGWLSWRAACPAEIVQHPLSWTVAGIWLQEHGQPLPAMRCLLESLSLDPDDLATNLRLAQDSAAIGKRESAARFEKRSHVLLAIHELALKLFYKPAQPDLVEVLARELEGIGRLEEALAWHEILLQGSQSPDASRSAIARIRASMQHASPLRISDLLSAAKVRREDFPLPDWSHVDNRPDSVLPVAADVTVTFADSAADAGIDFRFVCDPPADGRGQYLRESVGGGVAALDYDGDSWPDLYLTQAGDRPPDRGPQTQLDHLFRNLGNGQFQQVTELAYLYEDRYSGGVAAGDVDNDGWPDLYIGNIGLNRLYRNNGDGTFLEVATAGGVDEPTWTASCAIVDLNGDSAPDLFDVTYVGGDVHDKPCYPKACAPKSFPALDDRLWLATGDGRFRECGGEAGVDAANGVGLGLLAADFDGSGRLSLFVANDQTPNFFFANQTGQPGDFPSFAERATISGLAVDGWGRTQACMGVAAGDADGDGALDLFITNFAGEPNTLYRNLGTGDLFMDATVGSGLREPSIEMLGFGTQFIDADLDGWLDLIVTNGHVSDVRSQGGQFHMRPQYYHNVGQGQYVERSADELGPFFAKEYLGRGLARLDWNRDGLEDAAISHIEAPAALLTNTTGRHGRFLALQVRGVQSARDAIGATVHLQAGKRTWMAQLTAGDGYMASNQRQLVFGLGDRERVQELKVRWPSGLTQIFHDLPTNVELLLVEGGEELVHLPPAGN